MGKEIERKFLVTSNDFKIGAEGVLYRQGYITNLPQKVVRVRIAGNDGFLTIKGGNRGITRTEFEYSIPLEEATLLLDQFCEGKLIEKYRYCIPYKGFIWEVDEFLGDNEGLLMAEIELPEENSRFELPSWIGKEVSDDLRYYNANLLNTPYKSWK